MTTTTKCAICNTPQGQEHLEKNHEFSVNGELVAKDHKRSSPGKSEQALSSVGQQTPGQDAGREDGADLSKDPVTGAEPLSAPEQAETPSVLAPGPVPAELPSPPHSTSTVVFLTDPELQPSLAFPSDPVLRMALINRGILTADDLSEAEKQIAASIGAPLSSIIRKRSLGSSQVMKDN